MPGKRKTPQDYHDLAHSLGFEWVGTEMPKSVGVRTTWHCSKGHEWDVRFDRLTMCPHCYLESIRHHPVKYVDLARSRGFEWLGPEVPNTGIKTGWRCLKGHEWLATYDSIRIIADCPHCSNKMPKTPSDYIDLAHQRGFIWIGPEVSNAATKTNWRCPEGHEWQTSYDSIKQGKGCNFCDGPRPKTEKDYRDLASRLHLEWIGTEAPRTRIKTRWRCLNGHEWESTYDNIAQRKGCPFCHRNSTRKTMTDYADLGQKRGFIWLGPMPQEITEKTQWQCQEGHEWYATFRDIRDGSGCLYCSKKMPKTAADYLGVAFRQGLEWLGPEVTSVKAKTKWRCRQGHDLEANYEHVSLYNGCPVCRDFVNGRLVSKPQRRLCEILNGELNYRVGKYAVDVALLGEKIAVEYDGWYWHQGHEEKDKRRNAYLFKQGWRVLCIKAGVELPSPDQLSNAIAILRSGEAYVEIVLDWRYVSGASEQLINEIVTPE